MKDQDKKQKILLVDDDVDSTEALDYLAHSKPPCLIILDLMMPKLDGIEVLRRIRPTEQQIGLSRTQRASNVQGAFKVAADRQFLIAGRRVVLIDDVLTSGATVDACARALLRAKAASVDVLVFARVVDSHKTPI